jgi:hypothetical protein
MGGDGDPFGGDPFGQMHGMQQAQRKPKWPRGYSNKISKKNGMGKRNGVELEQLAERQTPERW